MDIITWKQIMSSMKSLSALILSILFFSSNCLGHADHHRSSPWVAACSPAVGPPCVAPGVWATAGADPEPLTLPGRLEAIAYLTMCLLNYTLVYGLPLLGVQAMLVVWWWGRESWLSKLHLLGKLSLFVFARVIESRFVLFSNELFHLEAMTDRSQPKKRSLRTVQLLVDITLTQRCAVSQKSERSYSSRVNWVWNFCETKHLSFIRKIHYW